MATDSASASSRLAGGPLVGRSEWLLAIAAALLCVVVTVALAAGHIAGAGAGALAATVFLLTAVWCLTERRAQRTLIVFGLYVGLLDGYVKLRTGTRGLTFARDVLLWAIAAGALWRAAQRGDSLRLPPLGLLVVAFVVITLAQIANPSSAGLERSLAGVRQHLEFVPLFFLGYAFIRTTRSLRTLLLVLVLIAAANGAVSYVQSTLTPEQLAGWGDGYRERVYGTGIFVGQGKVAADVVDGSVRGVHVRPFGLGSEIGAGAVAAAIALPGLITLLLLLRGKLRLLVLACAPAVAVGVVTSGSRAALIGCVASVLAFMFMAGASRQALRAGVVVAVLLALVVATFTQLGPRNDAARRAKTVLPTKALQTYLDERGDSVAKVGEYVVRYPLGLGVGTVGPAAHVVSGTVPLFDAETQWNLAVLEFGLAGLLILLLLGGRLIFLSFARIPRRADHGSRLELAAVAAPLVALFVLCFAGPISVSAPSAPYLWLAAGVLSFWLLGPGADDVKPEPERP